MSTHIHTHTQLHRIYIRIFKRSYIYITQTSEGHIFIYIAIYQIYKHNQLFHTGFKWYQLLVSMNI